MLGQVFSHFRIIEKLGQGGMGEVYLAEDLALQRPVALKFLSEHLGELEAARERFLTEARAAAALDNPFLCHIYEVGEAEGRSFIAMEYLEGKTLKECLRAGPLSIDQVLRIISDVAEGLEVAHRKGIVHRDLKPANIMLMTDGHAKVMDFGLARAETGRGPVHLIAGQTTLSDGIVGTPSYMSPEQISGEACDERSDIFALGIILYELLTGVHPFRGERGTETVDRIRSSEPQALLELCPNLPEGLKEVVEKTLEKEPDARFPSMQALVEKLQPLKAAEALPEVSARLKRSQWLIRGLGVTLILVLLCSAALFLWNGLFWGQDSGSKRLMLAVLPFQNLNGDDDQEYFSEGLTEEMISRLSRLKPEALGVIARSSVIKFKNAEASIGKIVAELSVDFVLEGSVRRADGRVRVTTTLIRSFDEAAIWSETYDREFGGVFQIQSEIARRIAEALALELLPQDEEVSTRSPTENTQAYEAYLRGRFHWNKRSADGLRRALEYFETAVDLDPNFAAAFAGIADTYSMMASYLILPEEEAFREATRAALRAVEIDDRSVEAHTALAGIWQDQWDWEKAEEEYQRAIALNPAYALAHQWYSELLSILGRHEESLREIEAAHELDPLSVVVNVNVGNRLMRLRRFEEAIRVLEESIELDPEFLSSYLHFGTIQLMMGKPEAAVRNFETILKKAPRDEWALACLGHAFALMGEREKMERIAVRLTNIAAERKGTPAWFLAIVSAGSGDSDRVFEQLEVALEARDRRVPLVKTEPSFDVIRNDPRYKVLLARMDLSP
ncbi:MAG: protein kinase [Acidobacteriota bacterium]|nr:MAG: protein kinase [Acidobacteriota bacterium]